MTWVGLIWAQANDAVIGAEGDIPWHIPEDLAHFREVTMGCPVIMGRKTWDSLPAAFRPLPGRENIVITRQQGWVADGARRAANLDDAVRGHERVWVIGGGDIYAQCISQADRLEITDVDLDVTGDAHAPSTDGWRTVSESDWQTSSRGLRFRFRTMER